MRLPLALIFSVIAFLLCAPIPALAQDQTAARIEALFKEMLAGQRQQAAAHHGTLETDGEILVENKGAYYAVTVPATTFIGGEGLKVVVGKIPVNVMAGDAPDLWKMALVVPSPIKVYQDNKPFLTLSLGAQSTSGVWNETLGNFVKLDSRIGAFKIREESGLFELSAPEISARYDLKETSKGLWSGPMLISMKEIAALFTDDGASGRGASFKAGELVFDYKVADLSPEAMKRFREQMGALAENEADPATGAGPSAEHIKGMYALIRDYLRNAFESGSGDIRVRNLEIVPPESAKDDRTLSLGEGGFGMDMSGFRSGNAALGFRFGFKEMKITPTPEDFGPLAPDSLQVNLSIDKIPLDKILELGKTTIDSAAASPEGAAQIAMMQAAMMLPALLSESGTTVSLKDNRVASGSLYEATLNGTAIAKVGAAHGAVVSGRMEIVGIENVVAWLKAKSDKTQEDVAMTDQALKTLTALQMVGQQGTSAGGKPSRTYDFVLDEQGKATLNGTDIEALMQTIGGDGGGAPTQPPQE